MVVCNTVSYLSFDMHFLKTWLNHILIFWKLWYNCVGLKKVLAWRKRDIYQKASRLEALTFYIDQTAIFCNRHHWRDWYPGSSSIDSWFQVQTVNRNGNARNMEYYLGLIIHHYIFVGPHEGFGWRNCNDNPNSWSPSHWSSSMCKHHCCECEHVLN